MLKIDFPLKEWYYKLEDKWFASIDYLDQKGIPSYTAIDPLERRGIPSLPIYTALAIIILYLVFAPALGTIGGAGGGIPVKMTIEDTAGFPIPGATLQLKQDGEALFTTLTNDSGYIKKNLGPGEYTLIGEKSNYEDGEKSIRIEEGITSISLTLKKSVALTGKPCFDTSDGANLLDSDVIVNAWKETGVRVTESIDFSDFEEEKKLSYDYQFETENYLSERTAASSIPDPSERCVDMERKSGTIEKGEVKVILKDEDGEPIKYQTVNLVTTYSEETDVVNPDRTDELGVAVFKAEVGKEFRVLVPSQTSGNQTYTGYLDNETHKFKEEKQTINVTISRTSPTAVITRGEEETLVGTYIKIFEGKKFIAEGLTDSNGKFTFGAAEGLGYTATAYLKGWRYTESKVIGGTENYIDLASLENPEEETGAIRAKVVSSENTERGQPGITVELKSYPENATEPMPTGYPSEPDKTNDQGMTTFEQVNPGRYCLSASRPGQYTKCTDHTITVEKGKVTNEVIEVEPTKHLLDVKVSRPDGEPAREATVNLMNWKGEEVTSKVTGATGEIQIPFEVNHGNRLSLQIDYTDLEGEKFIERTSEFMMVNDTELNITLTHLETSIDLTGIYKDKGDEKAYEGNLKSGKTYWFEFKLGIPNVTSTGRWDTVTSHWDFKEDETSVQIDELDNYGTPSEMKWRDVSSEGTGGAKLTVHPDFDELTGTYTLSIPVKISEEMEEGDIDKNQVRYYSEWSNGIQKRDPQEHMHIKEFTMEGAAVEESNGIKITTKVAEELEEDGTSPDKYGWEVDETQYLKIDVENTRDTEEMSGDLVVGNLGYLKFIDSNEEVRREISENKKEVLFSFDSGGELQPGETISIWIKTEAWHPGDSVTLDIDLTETAEEDPDVSYVFQITGKKNAYIEEPIGITIMTGSTSIKIYDTKRDEYLTEGDLNSLVVSGDALMNDECSWPGEGGPLTYSKESETFNLNLYQCPLKQSEELGTLNIMATATEYEIKDKEIEVTDCIYPDATDLPNSIYSNSDSENPNDMSISLKLGSCGLEDMDEMIEWNIGEESKYKEIADKITVIDAKDLAIDTTYEEIEAEGYYDGKIEDNLNFEQALKITLEREEDAGTGIISRTYEWEEDFTLYTRESGGGQLKNLFIPMSISKYTDDVTDCENKYCNIEQVIRQVEPYISQEKTFNVKIVNQYATESDLNTLLQTISEEEAEVEGALLGVGEYTVKTMGDSIEITKDRHAEVNTKNLQLFLPTIDASLEDTATASYYTKTNQLSSKVEDLLNAQWTTDSIVETETGLEGANNRFHIRTNVNVNEPYIKVKGHRGSSEDVVHIYLNASSDDQAKTFLEDLKGVLNTEDTHTTSSVFEVNKTGHLKYTTVATIYYHYSGEGEVNTDSISKLLKGELGIDAESETVFTFEETELRDEENPALVTIITCGQDCSDEYKSVIGEKLVKGMKIPVEPIGIKKAEGDGSGFFIFTDGVIEAEQMMSEWHAEETSFDERTGTYVFDKEEITLDELNDKMSENSFSKIYEIAPTGEELNLLNIPSINVIGDTNIETGNSYLFSKSSDKLYVKKLTNREGENVYIVEKSYPVLDFEEKWKEKREHTKGTKCDVKHYDFKGISEQKSETINIPKKDSYIIEITLEPYLWYDEAKEETTTAYGKGYGASCDGKDLASMINLFGHIRTSENIWELTIPYSGAFKEHKEYFGASLDEGKIKFASYTGFQVTGKTYRVYWKKGGNPYIAGQARARMEVRLLEVTGDIKETGEANPSCFDGDKVYNAGEFWDTETCGAGSEIDLMYHKCCSESGEIITCEDSDDSGKKCGGEKCEKDTLCGTIGEPAYNWKKER